MVPTTAGKMDSMHPFRVVMWGTTDFSKPRNRILLKALKAFYPDFVLIHADIWSGEADKTRIKSWRKRIHLFIRWLLTYPRLITRYLRTPEHDVVIIAYMGLLDVFVLWPFAKLRKKPIFYDLFFSLYVTVVHDRAYLSKRNLLALMLYGLEWLALRLAKRVLMDTKASGAHLANLYHLPPERIGFLPVGTELELFGRAAPKVYKGGIAPVHVLFCGQFIPVHGLDAVIDAISLARHRNIRWTLIGIGQERGRVDERIKREDLGAKVNRINWVPYETLKDHIAEADICLGIFADSDKAANSVPNKAFQTLAVGRPLITRDSPAMRELLGEEMRGVKLVPPANGEAILAAIDQLHEEGFPVPLPEILDRISVESMAEALNRELFAI